MRFVTYDAGAGPRVGMLAGDGDSVIDLAFGGDMVAFIEAGAPLETTIPIQGAARLLAPLRPRSLRDFLAFEGHMRNAFGQLGREIPNEWYEVPAYYKGMPDTVIGPDEVVPWPAYSEELDHELELAAIIGTECKDVAPAEAGRVVFGYTIWNDLSARDVQRREGAVGMGPGKAKDWDGSNVLGPCIVTADAAGCIFGYTIWNDLSARDVQARELPVGMGPGKAKDWDGSNVLGPCIVTADELDPSGLAMRVSVNGELWGEDTSAHMHHTFADMIAYVSRSQTLWPGEVLGSGTATGGSGLELDRWLQPGDVVEMEIQGIGVLRNRIGQKGAA